VFGCATQGELKALKEESRNEWVTIQRALTGRIDETNRQLDAQKKVSEEQQHALSELKRQIGSAASLQTKARDLLEDLENRTTSIGSAPAASQ